VVSQVVSQEVSQEISCGDKQGSSRLSCLLRANLWHILYSTLAHTVLNSGTYLTQLCTEQVSSLPCNGLEGRSAEDEEENLHSRTLLYRASKFCTL
jgi:hypothetical protein